MSPEVFYTGLEKEVTDAFYTELGTELDDVNYLDGIIFTIEYLKKNGMLDESFSAEYLKKKKDDALYFPDYHM